jgi:hypothetical protein
MAEGRKFEYPNNMTDDEIARLCVLVLENDRPVQPPLPLYATGIMPPGLSEEEALRLALQDSATPQPAPPPPSYNPWGPHLRPGLLHLRHSPRRLHIHLRHRTGLLHLQHRRRARRTFQKSYHTCIFTSRSPISLNLLLQMKT